MTLADFIIDTAEEALYVSGLITFVCITLGNLFGHGFHAEAVHELHYAFGFAGVWLSGFA